jgi:hypothetical protein
VRVFYRLLLRKRGVSLIAGERPAGRFTVGSVKPFKGFATLLLNPWACGSGVGVVR